MSPECCCICHDVLQDKTACVTLGCQHVFHLRCLVSAAAASAGGVPTCPLCRAADPGLVLLRNRRTTGAQDDPVLPFSAQLAPPPVLKFKSSLKQRSADTVRVAGLLSVEAQQACAAERPSDTVLLVDVSGSMAEPDARGAARTKMERTKEALCWMVNDMKPESRIALFSFNHLTAQLTPFLRGSEEGKARLLAAINTLHASGGTHIDPALAKAAQALERRAERNPGALVLLLTDGQDGGCHGSACADIKSQGAVTFTLGMGFDHDASLLARISSEGGGGFAYAETADMVQSAVAAASATAATLVGTGAFVELTMATVWGAPAAAQAPIAVGSILAGQTTFYPLALGGETTATLNYRDVQGRMSTVLLTIDVPAGGDVYADPETIELVSAHENRVAAASVLKDGPRLVDAGFVAPALVCVRECARTIRASVGANHPVSLAVLDDLQKEEANLQSRSYDRGASLSMAMSHGMQTASGTGGELYATQSQMATIMRASFV